MLQGVAALPRRTARDDLGDEERQLLSAQCLDRADVCLDVALDLDDRNDAALVLLGEDVCALSVNDAAESCVELGGCARVRGLAEREVCSARILVGDERGERLWCCPRRRGASCSAGSMCGCPGCIEVAIRAIER
jgi:hypothetical protein